MKKIHIYFKIHTLRTTHNTDNMTQLIDVRDGGARGAMAPPGKNLSRANVSPGQYNSHIALERRNTSCSQIDWFVG